MWWGRLKCRIAGSHDFEALIRHAERVVYAPPCGRCGNPDNPALGYAEPGWLVSTGEIPGRDTWREVGFRHPGR